MNDLDEMKKIWNDLDQKINVTEQVHAKIVKNIETHQFKSVLDKIYSRRLHEMFFCILFFALVLPLYQVYRGFNIVVFIAEELVLFLTTIGLFFQLIFISKFDIQGETELLKQNVYRYKKAKRSFNIICYFMAIVLLILILYFECKFSLIVIFIVIIGLILGCIMNIVYSKREKKQEKWLDDIIQK